MSKNRGAGLKVTLALLVLAAALLIAGCTSSTTSNTTPTTSTEGYNTTSPIYSTANTSAIDTQLAKHATPLENFTLIQDSTPPTYTGTAQDNGTLHSLTLIIASSSAEAQGQFAAQKATYADYAAEGQVTSNTATHWAVTTANVTVNVWQVRARTAGPFDLTLDTPYVLVSQDVKPPRR